jgi:oligoendopeptidase F
MKIGKAIKERAEVNPGDCWNVEAMYKNWEEWQRDFEKWGRPGREERFPELSSSWYSLEKVEDLKKILDLSMEIDCRLSYVYTYAHLRHDEDVAEEMAKKACNLAVGAFHAFREATSWIEPSLLQMSSDKLEQILKEEILKDYHIYLKKIIRLKAHTLSTQEEKLLAFSGRALETSRRVFTAFSNADLKFPSCKDQHGKEHELTHTTYYLYTKSPDRVLRKSAFMHLHQTFGLYENSLTELIEGQIQKTFFYARARKYTSCLEAALYPYEIGLDVYTSLVKSAKKKISVLHEYLAFRKKVMGYEELHPYDLNVPLVQEVDVHKSYDEGVRLVLESVSVLGPEYVSILKKGLETDNWVDRYENKRKRSGAYSSGTYDSMPYILLNYQGTLQDVMTLTHEAGHSMHSYYSHKHQKYQDSSYSIFVAEVASTFHEELLFRSLLNQASSAKEKAYLIHQKLDGIRSTFFRQVLFAEFELKIHELVEQSTPLTPALLKKLYLDLNQEYFGQAVTLDEEIAWEWARIPHFYSTFYVYQYATGISAAYALAKAVIEKEPGAQERYIEFISAGSTLGPIAVLQRAGVDMTTSKPVEGLLEYFKDLLGELQKLL